MSAQTVEKLKIKGGAPLKGEVTATGAKNAVSKMMIASLLTKEKVVLSNIPLNSEMEITREIVEMVGASAGLKDHALTLETPEIKSTTLMQQTRKNRISILAMAPLLARTGEAVVPFLGGDKIGARPVNFHIDILTLMGAVVDVREDGYYASVDGRLQGALIDLPYPSVGATETAMFAGVLAEGRTVIRNAAMEPEIVELVKMLQKMGAIIETGADRRIEILGVKELNGCEMTLLADRLEVASFACLALATGGDITVHGAVHTDIMTFINAVRRIGGKVEIDDDKIRFVAAKKYTAIELETDTHPGFVTDWQQPFVVVMTQAKGTSVVHETVFQDRFRYTETLNKMGANITVSTKCLGSLECRFADENHSHSAVINGPTPVKGIDMEMPDIRAGLALVIAALIAKGESTLSGVEHLDRGYEDLEERLRGLGAQIERV